MSASAAAEVLVDDFEPDEDDLMPDSDGAHLDVELDVSLEPAYRKVPSLEEMMRSGAAPAPAKPPVDDNDAFTKEIERLVRETQARPCTEKCAGGCGIGVWRAGLCGACEDAKRAQAELNASFTWAPPRPRVLRNLDVPELGQRVRDPKAIATVRKFIESRSGDNLLLLGLAGVGKTSLIVAAANADRLLANDGRRAYGAFFINGLDLSTSRARASLGEEAEEVKRAMHADLLVLDEFSRGRGGHHDATADVLMHRYDHHRPTFFTAPCTSVEELRARVVDEGVMRRVIEGSCIVVMAAPRRSK